MQMNHATFTRSPALRLSLKRGYATQAIARAGQDSADLSGLVRIAAELRPNPKALSRVAARIKGRPGVVQIAASADRKSLTFVARLTREIETRVTGEPVFAETGMIYLRMRVRVSSRGVGFHLSAISFCRHALERLVERADPDLCRGLLPVIDGEACAMFRAWEAGRPFDEAGDTFCPAAAAGVWAGGYDALAMDPAWALVSTTTASVPIFSARTFLSEAEMRPTVWLRWKDDPACRII
ncbi:hypothetical protein [Roseicyclus marinus]|uniref:hypothetical protein n=1 Tax=Roseicyclus marinus TaxID=2161673 RepID=UPI0024109953|nr:hypothetical protein [Roseicyclus marinus]MDG3039828.1 hypothetical protein [Roseicyclus marinus]